MKSKKCELIGNVSLKTGLFEATEWQAELCKFSHSLVTDINALVSRLHYSSLNLSFSRVHTHPALYFFLTFPYLFLENEGVFPDYISEVYNIFPDQLVLQMIRATDPSFKTK